MFEVPKASHCAAPKTITKRETPKDEAVTQSSCLSFSVNEAVVGARDVADAFRRIDNSANLYKEVHQPIGDILCGKLSADSFTRQKIDCLQAFVETLEADIAAETQTSIHFDECCMSGAWEETHVGNRGHAIYRLQCALAKLANSISHVVNLRNAEILRGELLR
ncbi:hypothetical protein [Sulfitobacter sp. PS-8MA]|uniref:hypothetical protein n=1 Tax=Sulfitobacter sp. PS-8MA TaxID=3237707 RepID=UPI0034C60145